MRDGPLLLLAALGGVCSIVAQLWCIQIARRVSPMWLLPLSVGFVFALPMFAREHWYEAKNAIRLSVFGLTLLLGGVILLLY